MSFPDCKYVIDVNMEVSPSFQHINVNKQYVSTFLLYCNTIKIKRRNYYEHFNILLTIHILFGTICLITGIVAMVAQKKKGKHTEWGEIYHASYVVITLTAIILSIINWDKIAYLFYVAIFSYAFAIYGYLARKTLEKLASSPY